MRHVDHIRGQTRRACSVPAGWMWLLRRAEEMRKRQLRPRVWIERPKPTTGERTSTIHHHQRDQDGSRAGLVGKGMGGVEVGGGWVWPWGYGMVYHSTSFYYVSY